MKQIKQNILVVAILFLSLLSSVALSYAITPSPPIMEHKNHLERSSMSQKKSTMQLTQAIKILLPKVAG